MEDGVEQDQAQLDREQEAPPAPQYVTAEDLKPLAAMIEAQSRQVAGLHSGWSRGLDAIRRDLTEEFKRQLAGMTGQVARREFLQGLDEEQRKVAEPLLAEIDRMRAQAPETAPAQAPQGQPAIDERALTEWAPVFRVVKEFGLDPADKDVAKLYPTLTDASKDPETNWAQFFIQLGDLRAKRLQAPAAGGPAPKPAQASAPKPPTVTPPVEGAPAAVGALRNADDVRDAFITGRITKEQYGERMRALGQTP